MLDCKKTKKEKEITLYNPYVCIKNATSGITLIALVITIIVLLILAGVTIAMLTGENGILGQANDAKNKTEQAKIEEQKKLEEYNKYITKEKREVPIPEGFYYLEGDKNTGLVISDVENDTGNIGNQFVFVPVDNPSEMYGTDKDGKKWGKLYNFASSGYAPNNWTEENGIISITSATGYREPDIVTDHDNNPNYNNGLFTKETIQEEFNSMIESVIKNKGFYVGRYELSLDSNKKAQSKKGETSSDASQADTKMWYGLYAKAKTYTNGNIKSSIIWGCQWDAILRWMQKNNIDVTSSTPNGAQRNISRITGSEEKDKLNNIYDILGDSWEWTLEAHSTNRRTVRSGYYDFSSLPNYRGNGTPYYLDSNGSSRFVLY